MKVVEYWHGIIKNYRYDGGVSVCGTYFVVSDTILVFKFFRGVFGGGTRLAMPKTKLRAGFIVIEAWFRGY